MEYSMVLIINWVKSSPLQRIKYRMFIGILDNALTKQTNMDPQKQRQSTASLYIHRKLMFDWETGFTISPHSQTGKSGTPEENNHKLQSQNWKKSLCHGIVFFFIIINEENENKNTCSKME